MGEHRSSRLHSARPKTRGECVGSVRPCPWVACRHHLGLEVRGDRVIEREPAAGSPTCSLDVADASEPATLKAIGDALGVTRERIRQIESKALAKLRAELPDDALALLLWEHRPLLHDRPLHDGD